MKPKAERPKNNKIIATLYSIGVSVLLGLSILSFGTLAIHSLFATNAISEEAIGMEEVISFSDSWGWNILGILLFIGVVWVFFRYGHTLIEKLSLPIFQGIALVLIFICGWVWVHQADSIPVYDAAYVFDAATQLTKGNVEALAMSNSSLDLYPQQPFKYFCLYPFQLGGVTLSFLIQSIFGSANVIAQASVNVFLYVLLVAGIYRITHQLFSSQKISFLVTCFSLLFVQPIFFCTYIYATIASFSFGVWAISCFLSSVQKQKFPFFSCLWMMLAILVKPNAWIIAIALCLVCIFLSIIQRHGKLLLTALCLIVLPYGIVQANTAIYENIAKVDYGPGLSQTVWLSLGMSEGSMGNGWYNGYTEGLAKECAYDVACMDQNAGAHVQSQLSKWNSNPGAMIDFYFEKCVSEWNETTYESLWVSQARPHGDHASPTIDQVYTNSSLRTFMDFHAQLLFVFYTIGCILFLIEQFRSRKEISEVRLSKGVLFCILPLVIFGAFVYHLLFEAKSQYLIVYLVAMMPIAAYGLERLLNLASSPKAS